MREVPVESVNVAEAKRRFSDLLGRVAYGHETVLITRRGRPVARLVPVTDMAAEEGLGVVHGWLAADDPFFIDVDAAVARRASHRPRVFARRKRA